MDETLGVIREKTGEEDLNNSLKSTMGGYTKKSVLEYVTYLKKQQADMKEAYEMELEHLRAEKDRLQKENSELSADLNEAMERITSDEDTMSHTAGNVQEAENRAAEAELHESEALQELAECRNALQEALKKNDELNEVIVGMSAETVGKTAEGGLDIGQIDALTATEEEKQVNDAVAELLAGAQALREDLMQRVEAVAEQARMVEILSGEQLRNSRNTLESMRHESRGYLFQNELLESEKDGLSKRVSDLMEENLNLGKENSRLRAANFIYERRAQTERRQEA